MITQLQKQQAAENGEDQLVQVIEESIAKVKDIAMTTKKSTENMATAED